MFQTGDLCKHFKGKDINEKNIYEILAMGVTYSGDSLEKPLENLVVYRNIFQGKIFTRELGDLTAELPLEKQEMYGQVHRVEKLSPEEVEAVKQRMFEMIEKKKSTEVEI